MMPRAGVIRDVLSGKTGENADTDLERFS